MVSRWKSLTDLSLFPIFSVERLGSSGRIDKNAKFSAESPAITIISLYLSSCLLLKGKQVTKIKSIHLIIPLIMKIAMFLVLAGSSIGFNLVATLCIGSNPASVKYD
ncbi:hypothetical protein GMOD_00005221 [Pyrenophora seminiperda CCB06]|uniref:Uncharacterized protein n=1 Tax=Pyrenophora seminiperda CCB06 TaxID=1302712 RepID=A0A3M7LV95_9PLEO|nr:hypothetical protein GMOD_00005221 [Pyrenophora seminiperda CCB06]